MAVSTESCGFVILDAARAVSLVRGAVQNLLDRLIMTTRTEQNVVSSQERGRKFGKLAGIVKRSETEESGRETEVTYDVIIQALRKVTMKRRRFVGTAVAGAAVCALVPQERLYAREPGSGEVDCSTFPVAKNDAIDGLADLEPIVAGLVGGDEETNGLGERLKKAIPPGLLSLGCLGYAGWLWRYDTSSNEAAALAKYVLPIGSVVFGALSVAIGVKGDNLFIQEAKDDKEVKLMKEEAASISDSVIFLKSIEASEEEEGKVIRIEIPSASLEESSIYREDDIFPDDISEFAYRVVTQQSGVVNLGVTRNLEVPSTEPVAFIMKSVEKRGKDLVIEGMMLVSLGGKPIPTIAKAVIPNAGFKDLPEFIPGLAETSLGQKIISIITHNDIHALDARCLRVDSEDDAQVVRAKISQVNDVRKYTRIPQDAIRALVVDNSEIKVVSVLKDPSTDEVLIVVGDFEAMNSTVETLDDVFQHWPCAALILAGAGLLTISLSSKKK